MRKHSQTIIPVLVLITALLCSAVEADTLSGLPDVTVVGDAVVSLRYTGTEYVVADGALTTGTTTRWYVIGGVEYNWVDGAPVPAGCPTVPGTSTPKVGDIGAHADDFLFRLAGVNHISSLDGIDFQQTVFPFLTDTFFVFERGGNDKGTVQAIFANDTLGTPLTLTANGVPYANTGVAVGDQQAFGYVLTTDVPVKGLRITASGHDALSISTPNPDYLTKARNPAPAQGEMVDANSVSLTWDPGKSAVLHDIYFSDNFDDVNTASSSDPMGPNNVYKARQSGLKYPPGLWDKITVTRGKTYYWRIDEVNGANVWRGDIWSFDVVSSLNWDPTPKDGASFVLVTTDLSWKKGALAESGHIIYLSTDFSAVNDAVPGTESGPAYLPPTPPETVTSTSRVIPGDLLYNTTYYWRADAVESAPPATPGNTHKGEVWSFTTILSIPITDPHLLGWWKFDEGAGTTVLDWSGHNLYGQFAGDPQWTTGYVDGALDFDGVDDSVEIASLIPPAQGTFSFWIQRQAGVGVRRIFGSVDQYESYIETTGVINNQLFGAGDIPGYIRSTQTVPIGEWTHVGLTYDGTSFLAQIYLDGGLDGEGYTADDPWAGGPFAFGHRVGNAQYYSGLLDDVRLYDYVLSAKQIKVLAGLLAASDPDPADGAADVQRTPTLTWEPGPYAASVNGHKVYFSADRDAVMNRTVTAITRTDPCYPVATTLDLGKTYYWAVDEVNNLHLDKVWPGDLWSFTTANNKVVEDIEQYVPNVPNPNIYQVWIDGAGDCDSIPGNNTGALVDIATLVGLAPVHGEQQAMKFLYDNDGTVGNPCDNGNPVSRLTYSKAEALVGQVPSGIGSDWTLGGAAKVLSLWFYGEPLNSIEPMWVQLTDASNKKAKVFYGAYADEDTSDMNEASWHEWLIDLADFTGVNLGNVKGIAIGVGTEGGGAGGSGTLYFDDIRLYAPRCILARREVDFAKLDYAPEASGGDCVVDYRELEIMSRDWLSEKLDESAVWSGVWSSTDVGAANGSFTDHGGGSYTIVGDGADIWGTADGFRYAYKQLSGDGQITVRVTSIDHTNDWAKAGVMIRETLDANSVHAMIIGRPNNLGISFQRRPTTGGISYNSDAGAPNLPYCLRLVRVGDTFTGYYHSNGKWFRQYSVTIPMTDPVYIGMVVTSHVAGTLCTAQIDRACSTDFIPADLVPDDIVNFKDYSELILNWLDENEWPLP